MALMALERALAINPNSAQVASSAAWVMNYAGQTDQAIALSERAIRLSPLDPELTYFHSGLAFAYLIARRYDEALATGLRAIPLMPHRVTGHRAVVAALQGLGRFKEARAAAQRYHAAGPKGARVFADRVRGLFADQVFAEALVTALRAAGLPE